MTHEIICLSNPYLALSSCGDVRNVFLLSHHGTGWRHQAADLLTEWASLYSAVVHVASAVVPVAPLCSKCYTIKKNCTISHQTEAPQVL